MKNHIIHLEVKRDKTNLALKIKIPKILEDFFSKISNGKTGISEKWFDKEKNKGAEFYVLTKEYAELESKVSLNFTNQRVINDYGNGLIDDNSINLAILRTKNASQGITICSDNFYGDNLDIEDYLRNLANITKRLLENVMLKKTIKAKITYQI